MLSMKFCIEWCRDQGLLSLEASKFWGSGFLGFQGFATYPNFKILGFQGLAAIKILRSWVSRVLRHNTISRSWVSRVPRQKGRARSKIHQGLRPWTQRTQDLDPFWNLGTSLLATIYEKKNYRAPFRKSWVCVLEGSTLSITPCCCYFIMSFNNNTITLLTDVGNS